MRTEWYGGPYLRALLDTRLEPFAPLGLRKKRGGGDRTQSPTSVADMLEEAEGCGAHQPGPATAPAPTSSVEEMSPPRFLRASAMSEYNCNYTPLYCDDIWSPAGETKQVAAAAAAAADFSPKQLASYLNVLTLSPSV